MAERFAIRLDPWWRLLLLVGGATPGNSYAEIDGDALHLRYGLLFDRTIPRAQIVSAKQRNWPIWLGIGWRTDFRGGVGLIGSMEGVVELTLSEEIRWGLLRYTRVAVSLQEPQPFLAALGLPG
jgi:hypothetical protein